jgi:PAS domain S-box-containing protein
MQKILAIDDKMDNLITLSALLKNLMPGCSVITAQSGMEGIEMARAELPDAILLDVKMPDMDGFETCRRLISDENTQHIPVIMITAIKTDPESRVKGLEIGANAFLAKPIDQHELVSQVKVALRIKKAEDALREQRNSLDEMVRERTAALRESEERYRKAFMTSPDSFVITRLSDGMFVSVNKGFTEISGYAEAEVIGKTSLEINIWKNPEDRIKIVEKLKAEGEVRNYEARFLAMDREFYGLMSASIIELNGVPHILNVTRDITEAKRAEKEKARLEARLQQAQKMESIGSLAGGIAHDLNNILFPISGLSEMLLDDIPPDTPDHESIEQIYKSAQRGSELVKQILAFSRQSSPKKLPIRIQSILKETLKLSRAAIPMNIEITSQLKADCGMVSADPTQIHQIAMNLITNAYHAVEQTGGSINIALKETAIRSFAEKEDLLFHTIPGDLLAGRYACISVSDTGTGIDQTQIDKIFDPYFTTKELGKGTGLGLSVVHGIVKEHGGDIRVYSEVGKGTTFNVYLPLLEDVRDSKAAAVIKQYPTGCERILLVDDEEPIVLMVQMMLEKLGYQVTARTSSPNALETFSSDPSKFDLVISDRGMPNMTGEQLAKELISIKPDLPVIICTGFSDENDEKRARDLGVKGFLKKPVATSDLATMVRKVLDEAKGTS